MWLVDFNLARPKAEDYAMPCPDFRPIKSIGEESVLFEATKFVILYYAAKEDNIIYIIVK